MTSKSTKQLNVDSVQETEEDTDINTTINESIENGATIYIDKIENVEIRDADLATSQTEDVFLRTLASSSSSYSNPITNFLMQLGAIREQQLIATEQLAVTGAAAAKILSLDHERLLADYMPPVERRERREAVEIHEILKLVRRLARDERE